MGLSNLQLTAHVARSVAGARQVWLAPDAQAIAAHLGPATTTVDVPSDADVAVVTASAVAADGAVSVTCGSDVAALLTKLTSDRAGDRTTAQTSAPLTVLAILMAEPPTILMHCPTSPTVVVKRAYSPLGVLEVTAEGLVIVELARGVSAVDLQRHAEPTLMVSPRVQEMKVWPKVGDASR